MGSAPPALGRAFVKNALFKTLGEIAIRFFSFLFVVLVARSLGDEKFGVLNFANSFALLFVVIVDFGLNPLLIRDAARDPGRTALLFKNLLAVKLGLAALFALALAVGWQLVTPDPATRTAGYWLAAFVMFNSVTEFLNAVFNAHQRMHLEAGIMAFQKTALLVLGLAALALGLGVQGVAMAYAAAGALGLAAAAFSLRASGLVRGTARLDGAFMRAALAQALPLTLTSLFINLYFRIDMTLLAKIRGVEEVGWYGAAHKCVEVMMIIPAILVAAAFPGFSQLVSRERERLQRIFAQLLRLLLLLGLPLAGGAVILAQPLMVAIFGRDFAAAGGAFAWLAVALVFIFLNYPLSYLLISGEKQNVNAVAAGLAVGISVAANLLLIPRFGHLGAAAAAVATEAFLFAAYWIAVNRLMFRVPLIVPVLKAAAAAGCMMLAVWPLRQQPIWLAVPAGMAVFAAAAILFRAVGREDAEMVGRLFKRRSHA